MAIDQSNPLAAYGYDQQTGQSLASSLGMSSEQLAQYLAQVPYTGGTNPTTTSYGMTTGGQPAGRDISGAIQNLRMGLGAGGLPQSSPSSVTPSSGSVPVSQDPMNAAVNLGAAALGMNAVYNPTPSQIPAGSKGGVSQVPSPTSSNAVPTVATGPWNTQASVFSTQNQAQAMQNWAQHGGSGNPADAASIEKAQGWAPGTIASKFSTGGNQAATGVAPTAGGTPTAVMPANAPSARPATPWATAPAAPSVDLTAHNAGLENAGRAIYAHFGGDPDSASPQDIASFHSQLAGMLASAMPQPTQGGAPTALAPAGPPPGAASPATPKAPVKMATGGVVPGDPNDDTDSVNAKLSPGEVVISKQKLREAQHAALMAAAKNAQQQSGNAPQQSSMSTSNAPAAPGGSAGGYTGPTAQQIVAQNQAANQAIGSGGAGSIDNLGTLGDEGMIGSMGLGVGSGAGSGMPTQQAGGVVSGLASGLAAAAQKYADSVKPWRVQPYAHPFGSGVSSAPAAPNFGQMTT